MASHYTRKELLKLLSEYIDKADERDIVWLKKWHNVKTRIGFFNLNDKRLKKAFFDLQGLMAGRYIRENK